MCFLQACSVITAVIERIDVTISDKIFRIDSTPCGRIWQIHRGNLRFSRKGRNSKYSIVAVIALELIPGSENRSAKSDHQSDRKKQ